MLNHEMDEFSQEQDHPIKCNLDSANMLSLQIETDILNGDILYYFWKLQGPLWQMCGSSMHQKRMEK